MAVLKKIERLFSFNVLLLLKVIGSFFEWLLLDISFLVCSMKRTVESNLLADQLWTARNIFMKI